MNINFEYNLSSKEFIEIANSVGCIDYSKKQVEKALSNSMYIIKATVDNKLAGMGRVVGDSSLVCILSDICVKPEFQKRGIGVMIVNNLKAQISTHISKGESMKIFITPTAGYENFYKKAGFVFNPNEISGMYLYIKK